MSQDIPLELIDPDPGQPRQHFDEAKIGELAASMAANGQAVPILLRPAGDRYIIVHGERRWRAAQRLGWEGIRAEVRDVPPDEARWLSLVENVQRADLSPVEEAQAYQARLAGGITQAALGERIGKTQSYIAQKLRLLKLPAPIQLYLDRGAITEGHARQLLKLQAMYGDWPADYTDLAEDWPELVKEYQALAAKDRAFYVFRDIRPEDHPPAWIYPREDDPHLGTLAEACLGFLDYVAKGGFTVPQWTVAAFWWASLAVYDGLNVADLGKALELWFERFCAAIWEVGRGAYSDEEPPPVAKKNQIPKALCWWGYRADLRHSNALGLAQRPYGEWPKRIHDRVMTFVGLGSVPAPSSCQSWGPCNDLYVEYQPDYW